MPEIPLKQGRNTVRFPKYEIAVKENTGNRA
jgi:hypothetical protein